MDLWAWKLPHSKEVAAFFQSVLPRPSAWARVHTSITRDDAIQQGQILLAAQNIMVRQLADLRFHSYWWAQNIIVVNCPFMFTSDVGHYLNTTYGALAVMWFYHPALNQIIFSLRSQGSVDVSTLAQLHGGGGHPDAAGFQLSWDEGVTLLGEWRDATKRLVAESPESRPT